MRIRYVYQGNEKYFAVSTETVVLGRPRPGVHVDVDLTPDLKVSRPHARISIVDGQYWIEDLGSTNGTEVDGRAIKGMGKVRLEPGQTIQISETRIEVEDGELEPGLTRVRSDEEDTTYIDVHDIQLDTLLQTITERLVEIIPGATRGALLLKDTVSGELLLKAHVPVGQPSISMTLATRTMARRRGFIWRDNLDPSQSQILNRMQTGMYVPLIWKDRVLGVACVDNDQTKTIFAMDDLRLMLAVAHYAAMAAAQNQLQEELRRNSALLGRLLTNFSPKLRETLVSRAAHGRLRLGGERSEVVILESDIRRFTQLTSGMDSDDVMDLLNDYFSVLTDAIFRHDGVVDKINGDAILAVFGSPEPDSSRHEKAIRAALAMQSAMAEVSEVRRRRRQVTCTIGIGIHCGEVLHGFIGSNDRMQLTVIGDVANWTARYCAGAAGGEILISPALHQRLWRYIDADLIRIDTKHEGLLRAYRVAGVKNTTRT
jgi:adenylate cyclase